MTTADDIPAGLLDFADAWTVDEAIDRGATAAERVALARYGGSSVSDAWAGLTAREREIMLAGLEAGRREMEACLAEYRPTRPRLRRRRGGACRGPRHPSCIHRGPGGP